MERDYMPPFQREAFIRFLYTLVPSTAIIAGGFAADWTQAKDVDLWVLSDPMLERTTEFLKAAKAKWLPCDANPAHSVPEEQRDRTVIRLDMPLLPVHIIGVTEQTVQDLFHTFDISTHRWAYGKNGQRIAGPGATEVWEPGKVLTYRFPASTDRRVKRLEERYGITIEPYTQPGKTLGRPKKDKAA